MAAASSAVGLLFGLAISRIPSPGGVDVFWISNLASPWLALAFLSARLQKTAARAMASGMAVEISCVVGFYGQFLLDGRRKGPRGVEGSIFATVGENLPGWLNFVAPWILTAVVAGVAYGAVGWWRGAKKSLTAGMLVAVPFLIEPWVWRFALGYDRGSWLPWIGEELVGLAITSWMVFTRVGSRRA